MLFGAYIHVTDHLGLRTISFYFENLKSSVEKQTIKQQEKGEGLAAFLTARLRVH